MIWSALNPLTAFLSFQPPCYHIPFPLFFFFLAGGKQEVDQWRFFRVKGSSCLPLLPYFLQSIPSPPHCKSHLYLPDLLCYSGSKPKDRSPLNYLQWRALNAGNWRSWEDKGGEPPPQEEVGLQVQRSSRKWALGGSVQWELEHAGDVAADLDTVERERYSQYLQLGKIAEQEVRGLMDLRSAATNVSAFDTCSRAGEGWETTLKAVPGMICLFFCWKEDVEVFWLCTGILGCCQIFLREGLELTTKAN